LILIVSLVGEEGSLHELEFVKPVERLVRAAGMPAVVRHHSRMEETEVSCSGIILCGTALGDISVLRCVERFSFLSDCSRPVLGICTGANLLSLVHGGDVEDSTEIGMVEAHMIMEDRVLGDLEGREVFALHTLAPVPSDAFDIIARSPNCVQAFRDAAHSTYGVLFHPEVRHRGIIERFCVLCMKGGGGD